jgi:hypothetical protein
VSYDRTYGTIGGDDPRDAVVSHLDEGGRLVASTFLGGSGGERVEGVVTDIDDSVVVVGSTSSSDFPVTLDAFQRQKGDGQDAFVAAFSSDLSNVLYSTFIGASKEEGLRAAATRSGYGLFAGGFSSSADWPIRDAQQTQLKGVEDAVFLHFSSAEPLSLPTTSGTLVGGF